MSPSQLIAHFKTLKVYFLIGWFGALGNLWTLQITALLLTH